MKRGWVAINILSISVFMCLKEIIGAVNEGKDE